MTLISERLQNSRLKIGEEPNLQKPPLCILPIFAYLPRNEISPLRTHGIADAGHLLRGYALSVQVGRRAATRYSAREPGEPRSLHPSRARSRNQSHRDRPWLRHVGNA